MPANDTYWRNLKKMHVVFALSAIGLFVATLGMMWKDHADEWRTYQKTFDRLEALRLELQIDADKTEEYEARLEELKAKLSAANEEYDEQQGGIEDEIAAVQLKLDMAERKLREYRAFRDKARADFDLAVRDEKTELAEERKAEFDARQEEVNRQEIVVQNLTTELNQVKQKQQDLRDRVTAIETEIAATEKDVVRLQKTKEKIAPENDFAAIKRKVMQWPIIDGFNSPHKIDQIWLPDLKITLGMAHTARFDRCKTCHKAIDQVATGNLPAFPHDASLISTHDPSDEEVEKWVKENKYPHPYATHPNPDLYLSSTSPHPTENFGCTICHDGQGSGTSFDNVQHTPNDPHEHELWAEKYHYHPNHFWEYPMKPERFRESSCLKCHHSVVELETSPQFGNSAPKLVKGFHTIEQFGCFGCHEMHGQDGKNTFGPDLRLEPNYFAVAQAISVAAGEIKADANGAGDRLKEIQTLADHVAEAPEDSDSERKMLQQLVLADQGLDQPLLDSRIHALADELKDIDVPGKYRKVGPALRHIDTKTTQGWLEFWTNRPQDFRPSTRMPQFFHLTNQEDSTAEAYQPVQIAAISHYLLEKSQPADLLSPPKDYQPDAARGEKLFAERGCLACHSHKDFPDIKSDFGPNLDNVHAKLKAGDEGFQWLYSWIRDPQRYHKRSKMPNLYLDQYEVEGENGGKATVDPAADIAAYLMKDREKNAADYKPIELKFDVVLSAVGSDRERVAGTVSEATGWNSDEVNQVLDSVSTEPRVIRANLTQEEAEQLQSRLESAGGEASVTSNLDRLVELFLGQSLTKAQRDELAKSRVYPLKADQIKGDEIELVHREGGAPSEEEWQAMKFNYVGRRTISQYGCYGCHDIPGFESAKPIGVALQDWGRKDTSRLAFEHIQEFLHHHNAPGADSPLTEQVESAMKRAKAGEFKSDEEAEKELSKAFYYDSILHHGRPGFIWQKLRQPRSYDYEKIETKRYDERLRMPKFPLGSEEIEAVATFVLGLTAEPPETKYLFKPQGRNLARYEGEHLLHKYNCTSCHMVELPEVLHAVEPTQSLEDVAYWFIDNREALVSGELAPKDYDPYYQRINEQLQQVAGVNAAGLAQQATTEAGTEESSLLRYFTDWFQQNPKTLASTYADYPGVEMTLEQILDWFVENRAGLIDGSLGEFPEAITKIQELCELFKLGIDVRGIAKLANVTSQSSGQAGTGQDGDARYRANLEQWFENHPEALLVDVDTLKNPKLGRLPKGVLALFKIKPPQNGETNIIAPNGNPVVRFHGIGSYSEEVEAYSYDLWETLSVGGRILMPTARIIFRPEDVVQMDNGRGGQFTEWLVGRLSGGVFANIGKARQSSPPPLIKEGLKVQTPWLYNFLKNPDRIRHETVLRMPQFNMSDAEARALANYFAAVDGAEYPYQDIPQRKPAYIAGENRAYQQVFPEESQDQPEYLERSWQLFGKFAACRQCHSVAGDPFKVLDPTQVTHGPDLDTRVADRFRPDYLEAWLHVPQWILPYTAMVAPTSAPLDGYFKNDPNKQVEALRDAMLNYNQLLQNHGKVEPPEPVPPVATPGTGTQ